jgi:hypothetical protein
VDVTGSYALGWWLCAALAVLAIPLLLLSTPPEALLARYRPEAATALADAPLGATAH